MTTPKTEPKTRKPTTTAARVANPGPTRQTNAPAATIEAFDRLNQKLDALANTVRDQSANMQQALQAIIAQLERQAALASPAPDASDILDQLKDLQDQQQNLQSQFNNNRLNP